MSWTKHRVTEPGASNGYFQILDENEAPLVVAVLRDHFDIQAGEIIPQSARADLIAAAPELLEALRLALEAAQQGVDDYSWEDTALSAIAKARGQA